MLTEVQIKQAQARAADMLAEAGVVITDAEREAIEVADFGLSDLETAGLEIVVYVNNERYCAKELVLFAHEVCPEHRHPPFDDGPGKQETFRCRKGTVYVYTEGEPTAEPHIRPHKHDAGAYSVWHEVVLHAGEQYTIPPNTLHWFAAGPEGAILSEFSSASRDDLDVFTDLDIVRETIVEND